MCWFFIIEAIMLYHLVTDTKRRKLEAFEDFRITDNQILGCQVTRKRISTSSDSNATGS